MFIIAAIATSALALMLVFSGIDKLRRGAYQMEMLERVGFPPDRAWLLASVEIAGAVGSVAGLAWLPLGIAASSGVVLYFLGAVLAHVRAGDRAVTSAGVMLLISIAVLALRITA